VHKLYEANRSRCSGEFSVSRARAVVRDLFQPRPAIYWADFLASIAVAYASFFLVRRVEWYTLQQAALFSISCLAIYRASTFTHELVHFRRGTFRVFRVVWNLLCGIPFLMPSFTYYTHLDHHRRKQYGTDRDGEYLPLGRMAPWHILLYLGECLVLPGLVALRFLVVAPLTWVFPGVQRWVAAHASSLVMDHSYLRPPADRHERRIWRLQEACCFLFCAVVAGLLASGLRPWSFLVQAYATGTVIILINSLRTVVAHRMVSDGRELSFTEQLLDSYNFPYHRIVSGLWAPVGLRFHALHHLFPSMPYHNLERAHYRLMANLPADSPYRQTVCRGMIPALVELWRQARESTSTRHERAAARSYRRDQGHLASEHQEPAA